ncbi:MAG: hypothetical protein LC624_12285 [Halobacteriales archaeon]|nr:hypothetical protein [Halobacteriales archaeon]
MQASTYNTKDPDAPSHDELAACPECGGKLRSDAQRGETACTRCGLVTAQSAIDLGPEWRAFTPEQHQARSRAGPPVGQAFPEDDLGAFVGFGAKDGQGRPLSPSARRQAACLRLDVLRLPRSLHEPALALFRKGHAEHVVRGRSVRGITAASLVLASRQAGIPLRLRDAAQAAGVDHAVLARHVKALARATHVGVAAPTPSQFVERLASEVGGSPQVVTRALGLLALPKVVSISNGRSPAIVAAAAVYVTQKELGEAASQAKLARAAGSSEVALRSNIRALRGALSPAPAAAN